MGIGLFRPLLMMGVLVTYWYDWYGYSAASFL